MSSPAPQSHLKTRQQEWLVLAVLTALATATYELWPELDLSASGLFFEQGRFKGGQWAWPDWLYHGMPIVGGLLSALAALTIAAAVLSRWLTKNWVKPAHLRRAVYGLLVVVLGVGLVVHNGFKDNWGRARPADVQAFGGSKTYLMAIGMLGGRRSRWRWWSAGMAAGGLVGLARMVEGRHFLGDVVFGGLIIWAVCLLLREAWLRLALLQRRKTKR
jgi:lipid A 4'-phosphatase